MVHFRYLGPRTQHLDETDTNSYTLEFVLPIRQKNFLTGRIELVDKDKLFSGQPDFESFLNTYYGNHPVGGNIFIRACLKVVLKQSFARNCK